jgi:chromate transporter
MIAIAESTPGPVAINMATYVGYKTKRFWGSFFATIGVILPSFTIIFLISLFLQDFLKYELVKKAFKGISCAVAVIIFFAGVKLFKNLKKTPLCLIIFATTIIMMILNEIKLIQFTFLTVSMIAIGGLIGILTLLNDNRKDKKAPKNVNTDTGVEQ